MVSASLPSAVRYVVFGAACVYLLGLLLDGVQPKTTNKLLPPTLRYFVQATCLFPRAATMAIDYRLEGWDCGAQRFRELSTDASFPLRPHDKENRFQHAAHFHRQNRPVMEALEDYVLRHENGKGGATRWGGIRVSSVRIPLPEPGEPVKRWSRPVLEEHPRDLIKHWFYTPVSRRERHCGGATKAPSSEVQP